MAQMTEQKLVSIVNTEMDNAMGAASGEIAEERAKAWSYYLSQEALDIPEGESKAVSSAVADVIDGTMPDLLKIFTTADNLVSFDAVGAEDEQAAEQESDYVNYLFFKRNPAFLIMFYWIFDALLQKNGITKAYWDDSETVTTETYKGLNEDELLELMGDDELEPVERDERQEETVINGEVVFATVHDVTFKRTEKDGSARVVNVPPDEYRISSDSASLDPSGARMVGHEREMVRSDLLDMDFPKELVNSLSAEGDVISTPEERARKDKTDDQHDVSDDKSQDKILVREAYIKVDYDGDGHSELRQVFTAGDKLLSNEEVDRQPFHVICPHPLSHKHFGRASAEKVMDVQDADREVLRQTLMNLYHNNNPGHGVWEQGMGENTLDDLLTTSVGGVKRFARPVPESYQTITIPFTAQHSFAMLEHFDRIKRDRAGIRNDGEGLDVSALKHVQQSALMQNVDQGKAKIEAIARIFAETGFKSLFLHLHELVQKHQKKADVVKLRGQWVDVDPQAWRTRKDMTVNIGLGIGTREQNLLHLDAIWQKQSEMADRGLMNLSVTPQHFYRTAAEIVKNANLKLPQQFFADPGDQQAPPPNEEQIQLQKQAQAQNERQQQLDARKQELDARQQQARETEMQLKHQREMLELERKREKDKDDLQVAMEQIANKITELDLKFSQVEVPGSRT